MTMSDLTETQKQICTFLGFEPPSATKLAEASSNVGLNVFSCDGMTIRIGGVPYIKPLNEILTSVGFRWNPEARAWDGHDRTERAVEVLQAFAYCRSRSYPRDNFPPFAEFWGGSVPVGKPANGTQPPETGGWPVCPVTVKAGYAE